MDALHSREEILVEKVDDRPISERKRKLKGMLRMSEPDRFARFHKAIRTRNGEEAPGYPSNYQIKALEKAWARGGIGVVGKRNRPSTQLEWIERGPTNVAGRARVVLVDSDDPTRQTWFVGSAGGGIWKTENAGESWINLTHDLPNLATTTLAMPASDPDVIYAGTGEGYGSFAFVYGQGIWKSTDKGVSWTQLPATSSDSKFTNVLRIIVNPQNGDHLVAATSTGLRRAVVEESFIMHSLDGGASWEIVYSSGNRVEQVLADPNDFQVQYATLNGKGVLKSTDGGIVWEEKFDAFFDVGRLEMAIAPSNASRLYVAAEGGLFPSTLFISPDAGESWEMMDNVENDPPEWLGNLGWYSNAVAVDPYDENKVFVGGIDINQFDISTESFVQGYVKHVEEDDPTGLFVLDLATSAPKVASRLGQTHIVTTAEFKKIEIRWGPQQQQKAHRFIDKWFGTYVDYIDVPFEVWDIENNQQLMAAYEDEDEDGLWDLFGALDEASERIFVINEPYNSITPHVPTTTNAFNSALYVVTVTNESDEGIANGPFPDAVIRVIPEKRLFRSYVQTEITRGYSQTPSLTKGVHVDHHHLNIIPVQGEAGSSILLDANDGGVAFSYDAGLTFTQSGDTFSQRSGGISTSKRPSRGLNTAQFYGVDKMNGGDRYVGGTQDNGSWISPSLSTNEEPWRLAPGGDGFEVAWHYKNPDWIIYSSQFNRLYRSKDGGVNWQDISPPGSVVFMTRIAKTNQQPDLIFTSTPTGVARSTDFGSTWERIDFTSLWPFDTQPIVRISLASPDIVWAGATMGDNSTVFTSQDGGQTFARASTTGVPDLGVITNIQTHPSEPHTAFALFSISNAPKIMKTEDLGETWVDLSGFATGAESSVGFPDVAVYSLLVMPHNEQVLWAGTEIGIFESNDGGQNWHFLDSSLPAVSVWQMRIVNDQVVVATHGRGIWSVQIPELADYNPSNITLNPVLLDAQGGAQGHVEIAVDLRSAYDSTLIFVDGQAVAQLPQNTDRRVEQVAIDLSIRDRETVNISAWGYLNGQALPSMQREHVIFALRPVVSTYISDFDNAQSDFILDGFSIHQEEGLGTTALHSLHPYPEFQNATALFRTPVRVGEDLTKIVYDEIALIEAGKSDVPFGSEDFYDYVLVEGSVDNGLTWQPLIEGYDIRYSEPWQAGNDISTLPGNAHFVTHEIDLANTYQPGEEVLIRFRLVSDNAVSGWGWVVDNLNIQSQRATSAENDRALPEDYALMQNYPNPFSKETTFIYTLPEPANVTLSVFDINGRLVQQLVHDQFHAAGSYRQVWNGATMSGGEAASGVYFYRLDAGGTFREVRQLIKLK